MLEGANYLANHAINIDAEILGRPAKRFRLAPIIERQFALFYDLQGSASIGSAELG